MPAPRQVLRKIVSLAVHGELVGRSSPEASRVRSTSTIYPPCPECHKPMRLTHDAAHAYNGLPTMFYCPEDGSVLQRIRGTHEYRRMSYTVDGRLVPFDAQQTRVDSHSGR